MRDWQKKRNYWKVKGENGHVVSYIIKVDGQEVEVNEEVYRCYAQGERRERYILEDQKKDRVLSLEQLARDEVREDYVGIPIVASCLDILVEQEQDAIRKRRKAGLYPALQILSDTDRELITKRFFEGLSQDETATEMGIHQSTVSRRQEVILRRLRRNIEKYS